MTTHQSTIPLPNPTDQCNAPSTTIHYQPDIKLEQTLSVLSPSCSKVLQDMPLGSHVRRCFNLEQNTAFLNHGSYGTAPSPVLTAQAYFVNRMEMNPDRFMIKEKPEFLKRTRQDLAQFLQVDVSDLVLVSNATTGVNSVLRSLDLQDGDEVLCLNLAYPAILNTLRHICYYTQELVDLKVIEVQVPLQSYEQLIQQVMEAITDKTRLAVFDHITSATGLVLPVEALIQVCHNHGVPVLIDGAHGPGQLNLNLTQLNADFYVGNCYKWLFTSKGCAFLHVNKQHQSNIRPVVTSLGYEQGFLEEFAMQGTRDEANFFTIPTALDFFRSVGIERIYAHNTGLINWASEYLAHLWGTEVLLPPWQRAPFMCCIRIPLDFPSCAEERTEDAMLTVCNRVSEIILDKCNIVIKVAPVQGKMYIRISAQIYNERQDYVRLGEAISKLTKCPCITEQFQNLQVKE